MRSVNGTSHAGEQDAEPIGPIRALKLSLARRVPSLLRLQLRLRDRPRNRRWVRGTHRFLIVREASRIPEFYDVILDWIEAHVPEIRRHFELRVLPCRIPDWSLYALHVPWLQDPVESWSPQAYDRACQLARECDRRGIPVVNRVERLRNAMKLEAASRLSRAGVPTPAMRLIDDHGEFRANRYGLKLPLFVREDAGHGGPMLRADTDAELRALPLENFQRPVAVELIDVRSPEDGLCRKFRYVVAGRVGVPHHMQATEGWITRGTIRAHTPATRAQEEAYIGRPDPRHELFQRARQALEFDLVAFDYGFDQRGRFVVWEANPYPHFHVPSQKLAYLAPAMDRTLAAVVHLYLERAGMEIPQRLQDILFASDAVTCDPTEDSHGDPRASANA
jgi:hypothetical protein